MDRQQSVRQPYTGIHALIKPCFLYPHVFNHFIFSHYSPLVSLTRVNTSSGDQRVLLVLISPNCTLKPTTLVMRFAH